MVATEAPGEARLRASTFCSRGQARVPSLRTRERASELCALARSWRPAPAPWLVLLGACAALLLGVARARAEVPLAVEQHMAGIRLGRHMALLEDPDSRLSLADLQRPEVASRFVPAREEAPGMGLTRSSFWLRFTVANASDRARPWLLEFAYPHLDYINLYVPRADGGHDLRKGGDFQPFSQRDLNYRNVVFTLEAPPRSELTYFARVQTSGSLNLPLVAWTTFAFVDHQNYENAGFWLFYGVLLVMAAYNFALFLFLRQGEYMYYVLYNLSLLLFQFTLHGHTFQYLLPNGIWLANHILPFSIGVNFLWATLFLQTYLNLRVTDVRGYRLMRVVAWIAGVLSVFGLFGPYAWSIRVLVLCTFGMAVNSLFVVIPLARRGLRQAQLFILSWGALVGGVMIYLLKTLGLLPSSIITDWGIEIGAGMEVVLLSLALADRINLMRANLSELNAQLSQNVSDLKRALDQAEAGTRAKSEFLATVSHELRTPLNTIINIPQGLLRKFPTLETATCENCDSIFELEEGDTILPATPCPECGASNSLSAGSTTRFDGEPDAIARHLKHIERSGRHLLQMVNGILDFSKFEAGKLGLSLDSVDVGELLSETVEPLGELASGAGVQLQIDPNSAGGTLRGDPLRLRQVLINLIGNAIKFSDGRGTVTVSAQREGADYVFAVRDEGIGIAEHDRQRIFQTFEQVDRGDTRKYGGTGLGLAICKALVHMHEGEIWVESELGAGSVFRFRVPVAGPKRSVGLGPSLPRGPVSLENEAGVALGRESAP
jgi:signal transduction histidine kinase